MLRIPLVAGARTSGPGDCNRSEHLQDDARQEGTVLTREVEDEEIRRLQHGPHPRELHG